MAFAQVAVQSEAPHRQAFTYAVPDGMDVAPGCGVVVPFGAETRTGVVVAISAQSGYDGATRELLAVAGAVLAPPQIALAGWLSRRYLAPLYPCVALMLPPGFDRKLRVAVAAVPDADPAGVEGKARDLLERLISGGECEVGRLRRSFRADTVPALQALRAAGLVRSRLTMPVPAFDAIAPPLPAAAPPPLTPAQARAVRAVTGGMDEPVPPGARPPIFLLNGVTASGKTEVYMAALDHAVARGRRGIVLVPEIALTPQAAARFEARFPGRVALIHSDLTDAERTRTWHAVRAGRYAVVVGPRSALFAPQPDLGVIVVDEEHEWTYKQEDPAPRYHARDAALQLAQQAAATVILGSATPDVVSYARAKAGHYRLLEMGERVNALRNRAPTAVASALTPGPSPESGRGVLTVTGLGCVNGIARRRCDPSFPVGVGTPLPDSGEGPGVRALATGASHDTVSTAPPTIEIIDLAAELRAGNRGIFSRALDEALAQTLARGEQALLFLNKRGSASFVLCRECGHVPQCAGCLVPLTVHGAAGQLRCHQCNRARRLPERCPACGGGRVRTFGLGTQRVEEEVRARFPAARVLRWDRDVAATAADHAAILEALRGGAVDVVVGTQMIAKGHDLPNITLVGVISADIALHLPDYRGGERAYQLLTQVAGRAGRAEKPGRVIVQTYTPDHYAIRAAADGDYQAMVRAELGVRRQAGYPPFGRLARLLYSHTSAAYAENEAHRLAAELRAIREAQGIPNAEVIGPAPAFHARIRGRWRWQITLRAHDPAELIAAATLRRGWTVDIDPTSTS